jgi:hypothetical protein
VNLPKSPLRRAAVLAAGTALGLSGIAVAASPAYAHHAEVSGVANCVDGVWNVDWTVVGIGAHRDQPFRLIKADLTPAGTTVTNIAASTEGYPYLGSQPIKGVQTIAGNSGATEATLTVQSLFDNGKGDRDPKSGSVPLTGPCEVPPGEEPPVEEPPVEEPPAEEPPASPSPSASVSASPSTPASESPSASVPPSASPSTPVEPEIPVEEIPVDADIKEIFEVTCDTITIGLDNPADSLPIKLDFKTSKGEERTLTINPGEAKSGKFSASEGFNVDVTITVTAETETYSETVNVPWEKPAGEDCEGGNGGGLPVTGAAAGGVAGGAAALLAVGGALFFMARRRKLKFTA